MSAEVKVAVRADNQVRTGLQQALNDVKKFGAEAGKAGGPQGGMAGVTGDKLRNSIKGLGQDLAAATSPGEALQAVASRVAGAFGKLTAFVGGLAIGQIVAGQFGKIDAALAVSTKAMNDFGDAYQKAATATTFDSAVSQFQALGAEVEKVRGQLDQLKRDPGAVLADGAMRLFGMDPMGEMRRAANSMEEAQASALMGSLMLQQQQAEEMAAVAGDPAAEAALKQKQERDRQRLALQQQIDSSSGNTRLILENALDALEAIFDAQDSGSKAADKKAQQDAINKATAESASKQAQEKRRAEDGKPTFGPGNDESANGGWRVQAAEYERKMQAIQAERQQQIAEAMESSQVGVGSLVASDLQRVGGASMEFADSRGLVTDLKKQTGLLEKIEKNTRDKETTLK